MSNNERDRGKWMQKLVNAWESIFVKLHAGKIQLLVRAKLKLKNCILNEKAWTFVVFQKECTVY